MDDKNRPQGKISRGMQGQSEISEADIESRAREIARHERPESSDVRQADRDRARSELQGEDIRLSTDEAPADIQQSRDPAEPVAYTGTRSRTEKPADDVQTERLAKEGVSEAEHDERRAARDAPAHGMEE